MAKHDLEEIFFDARKDFAIRAVKKPGKKNEYVLVFENGLAKKDAKNILEICEDILEKEDVKPKGGTITLYEVKEKKK